MVGDGKAAARRVWGDSPTGTTTAGAAVPGTREFFEPALAWRTEVEQPWLPEVVPFDEWRGQKVLEVGHGPGFDALAIVRAGADYTGIDLVPENVERTRQHLALFGLDVRVQEGDAEALAFPDASFDVVYSNGVLHHTPDIAAAFREARRVLKPGGRFYVIVYHRNSIFYWVTLGLWFQIIHGGWRSRPLAERVREIEFNRLGEKPIVNVYSRRDLRLLLSDAGFTVSSIAVRKLTAADLPQLWYVHRLFRRIPARVYSALARSWGWYLIAEGLAGDSSAVLTES